MHAKRIFSTVMLVFAILVGASGHAKDNVILRFNFTDGANPVSALISDGKGNLYGTASGGNTACYGGCGVIYELSPAGSGKWKETMLYAFLGSGGSPPGALIMGKDGDLYGTISFTNIFQLRNSNGQVKEKVIYDFDGEQQGSSFGSELVFDDKGNLYGSLWSGGPQSGGSVFELTPQANGIWNATILHSFGASGDGNGPAGGVVLDGKGNVFGTTIAGGAFGYGTVFELSPNPNGNWSESILYSFSGKADGGYPYPPLTIGPNGNLFGTTDTTAFELIPNNNSWILATIYSFGKTPVDGSTPSGLSFDAAGDAYGVTSFGGDQCNTPGCGIVFELAHQSDGNWKETILHQFESAGDGSEVNFSGANPKILIDDSAGRIYGATPFGGDINGDGTVFFVER